MHLHKTMLPVLKLNHRHVQGYEAQVALTLVLHMNYAETACGPQPQLNFKVFNMAGWLLAGVYRLCMSPGHG